MDLCMGGVMDGWLDGWMECWILGGGCVGWWGGVVGGDFAICQVKSLKSLSSPNDFFTTPNDFPSQ